MQGCQFVLPFDREAGVVNLPELCKLSLEELLRVTAIDDAGRQLPVVSLIELPLEELLTIGVVGHSHTASAVGASAAQRATTVD